MLTNITGRISIEYLGKLPLVVSSPFLSSTLPSEFECELKNFYFFFLFFYFLFIKIKYAIVQVNAYKKQQIIVKINTHN